MPLEIFEKIIGFTIPDDLHLCIVKISKGAMPLISWSPEWVPTLRLVSRRFRNVAQVTMVDRCGFYFSMAHQALQESMCLGRENLRRRMKDWIQVSAGLPTGQSSLAAVVYRTVDEHFDHVQRYGEGWSLVFTPY
jgi:hypothetical protein